MVDRAQANGTNNILRRGPDGLRSAGLGLVAGARWSGAATGRTKMKLSDTALIVLNGAAGRDDRLVPRRTSVAPVADVNACRALVKQGIVEVVRASTGVSGIVTVREDDSMMAFVIAPSL